MQKSRIVESENELLKVLKADGVIYAKGTVKGNLRMKNVSLVDGVLTDDISKMPKNYNSVLSGEYIEFEVQLGEYQYDKKQYEEYKRYSYIFDSRESTKLRSKTVQILGMEFNVEKSKKLLDLSLVLRNQIGEDSIIKNENDQRVPSLEMADKVNYYAGYKLYAIPSEIKGALKLCVENGKLVEEEFENWPQAELKNVENMMAGTFDYTTEVLSYLVLWAVLVLIAWLIMKFFRM